MTNDGISPLSSYIVDSSFLSHAVEWLNSRLDDSGAHAYVSIGKLEISIGVCNSSLITIGASSMLFDYGDHILVTAPSGKTVLSIHQVIRACPVCGERGVPHLHPDPVSNDHSDDLCADGEGTLDCVVEQPKDPYYEQRQKTVNEVIKALMKIARDA